MIGGLQGEEWKFIQKYQKKRSKVESAEQRKICTTHGLCEFGRCCANFAQALHKLKVLCEFPTSFAQAEAVVRISHKLRTS